MTDYRVDLPIAIPVAIFLSTILITFLIGFLMKTKRALYWSIGNCAFLGVGFLLAMFFSEQFARAISNIFPNLINASAESIYDVALPLAPLLLYIIAIIGGNLVILLPLYYLLFKKILHLGKYEKKQPTTVGKSFANRTVAGILNCVLCFPISMIASNAGFAFTSTSENIQKDSTAAGMYNFSLQFTNIFGYWKEPLLSYADGLFSMLVLTSKPADGGKAPIDNFKDSIANSFAQGADITQISTDWNTTSEKYGKDLTNALNSDALTDAMISEMQTGLFENVVVNSLNDIENVYNQLKNENIIKISGKGESIDKIANFITEELQNKLPNENPEQVNKVTNDIINLFFTKN